jgi:hypothetical protein
MLWSQWWVKTLVKELSLMIPAPRLSALGRYEQMAIGAQRRKQDLPGRDEKQQNRGLRRDLSSNISSATYELILFSEPHSCILLIGTGNTYLLGLLGRTE